MCACDVNREGSAWFPGSFYCSMICAHTLLNEHKTYSASSLLPTPFSVPSTGHIKHPSMPVALASVAATGAFSASAYMLREEQPRQFKSIATKASLGK